MTYVVVSKSTYEKIDYADTHDLYLKLMNIKDKKLQYVSNLHEITFLSIPEPVIFVVDQEHEKVNFIICIPKTK